MLQHLWRLLLLLGWLSLGVACWAQDPPTGAEPLANEEAVVEDQADLLMPEERALIAELLRLHNREGSGIVQLVIIPELPVHESIESVAGARLIKELDVRGAKQARVLLFIAMADRKLRIATSDAVRSSLPDAFCEEVIDNQILPRFRRGDFYEGIRAGLGAIISKLEGAMFAVLPDPSFEWTHNGQGAMPLLSAQLQR